MGNRIQIEGDRYGRLVVLSREPNARVRCQCDCGNTVVPLMADVRRGNTKSCGCLGRGPRGITKIEASTYNSWASARARCLNPSTKGYHRYGGRGIKICDRWAGSFEAFLEDMGRRPVGMSLDRIDYDGDYELANCRWATLAEQANNTPLNVRISHEGESLTVAQWSKRLGINRATIDRRLAAGLATSEVLALHKHTRNQVPLKLAEPAWSIEP